ncbi:MAG TPA: hypothetical protein GXZ52_04300 [Clostridiales bacterium]|nr:hypothetical protein [Clostridiales bacterium]
MLYKTLKTLLVISYTILLLQTPAAAQFNAYAGTAPDTSPIVEAIETVAGGPISYPDVLEQDWFYSDVMALTELNILQGYGDGLFYPDDFLTVGQFLKMIGCAVYPEEIPEEAGGIVQMSGGGGMPETHWASRYFCAALDKGLVLHGEFENNPDSLDTTINRYQMSVILVRTAEKVLGEGQATAENLENFIADSSEIPEEYIPYVRQAYAKGLLRGDALRNFRGAKELTRAEAAAVVMRLIDPQVRPQPDFSSIPPEPVTEEWFADAIFIGDSLTHGLQIFSGLKTPRYLCYQSVSAANFSSYKCINNMTLTIPQALSGVSGEKVFIMLGINDLGSDVKTFKNRYEKVLDTVESSLPEARIYIQSLTPVSADQSAKSSYINRSQIQKFNACIEELAKERGLTYIDVYGALADSNGDLPKEGIGWDGVHLSTAYYVKWYEYLKTAVVSR